jgi:hypothetical protein
LFANLLWLTKCFALISEFFRSLTCLVVEKFDAFLFACTFLYSIEREKLPAKKKKKKKN